MIGDYSGWCPWQQLTPSELACVNCCRGWQSTIPDGVIVKIWTLPLRETNCERIVAGWAYEAWLWLAKKKHSCPILSLKPVVEPQTAAPTSWYYTAHCGRAVVWTSYLHLLQLVIFLAIFCIIFLAIFCMSELRKNCSPSRNETQWVRFSSQLIFYCHEGG